MNTNITLGFQIKYLRSILTGGKKEIEKLVASRIPSGSKCFYGSQRNLQGYVEKNEEAIVYRAIRPPFLHVSEKKTVRNDFRTGKTKETRNGG